MDEPKEPETSIPSDSQSPVACVDEAAEDNRVRLTEDALANWGATHKPPQIWFEQDEEDLFSPR